MKKKTILFDLDGTITDSGEGIINSVIHALEYYHLPIPDRETLRVFVGPPLHESFIKFGVPQSEAAHAVEIYRERYIPKGMFENTPYEGIATLLGKLKADGHTLYVATSKPESMAVEILEHFNLAQYFDIICGATMDASRTAKDKVISYLLTQTGRETETIMVGDTEFDVKGAAIHAIPTIGVSWGYGSVEIMQEAGAIAIAHSMNELYQIISAL